jgi:hypothetical protein
MLVKYFFDKPHQERGEMVGVMNDCSHPSIVCINPYEIVRKYRCDTCGGVMMCACDEKLGRRFFSHQLGFGTELETQRQVPVTLGFQKDICNTCRGVPEEAHPKAEIHGHTSKIRRYYWREILLETTKRFGDWQETPEGQCATPEEAQAKRKSIEKEVVKEVKRLHKQSPKYIYQDKSQSDIIDEYQVEVVELAGIHSPKPEGGVGVFDGNDLYSPEEFVARHFQKSGYNTLFTESIPFHALFGIFMWILIQDPKDPDLQMRGFGNRIAFDEGREGEITRTLLPPDFGTSGYAKRREHAIDQHIDWLQKNKDGLLWTFDYWIEPSLELRQYLWAHRPQDVDRARQITSILPPDTILRILRYLVGNYWQRYCGWPDLLLYKESEFLFIEVKSSKDALREDQKNWIRGNYEELHLPFRLAKIHNKKPGI